METLDAEEHVWGKPSEIPAEEGVRCARDTPGAQHRLFTTCLLTLAEGILRQGRIHGHPGRPWRLHLGGVGQNK